MHCFHFISCRKGSQLQYRKCDVEPVSTHTNSLSTKDIPRSSKNPIVCDSEDQKRVLNAEMNHQLNDLMLPHQQFLVHIE